MAFCANCGKEMSDHAVACPNCGHPTGVAGVPRGGGAGNGGTAEWWKRLVAYLIDGVAVSVAGNIIAGVAGLGVARNSFETGPGAAVPLQARPTFFAAYFGIFVVSTVITLVYFAVLNGSEKGQTLGKMVLKIQVRDVATGGPIGIQRGFIRAIIPALGFLTCGILPLLDGLWPLWDPNGQALHDKMAQSHVVDVL